MHDAAQPGHSRLSSSSRLAVSESTRLSVVVELCSPFLFEERGALSTGLRRAPPAASCGTRWLPAVPSAWRAPRAVLRGSGRCCSLRYCWWPLLQWHDGRRELAGRPSRHCTLAHGTGERAAQRDVAASRPTLASTSMVAEPVQTRASLATVS